MAPVRARRGSPFDAAERAEIVGRFREASIAKRRAELTRPEGDTETPRRAIAEAVAAYIEAVPIVALSRSPRSGEVFETSLDTLDLDGPWWAYEAEHRPWVAPPPDLFAWTGALKPDGPFPAWTPKAMVGPEVPFVLPRILDHPAIKAVVSAVRVGPHVGYPIAYFADPVPHGLERVDDWGHASYTYLREDGAPASAHATEADHQKDFDLRPWLERGKLAWIAPGDEGLELRHGADGCPYLDLPGERRRRYLQGGEDWFA